MTRLSFMIFSIYLTLSSLAYAEVLTGACIILNTHERYLWNRRICRQDLSCAILNEKKEMVGTESRESFCSEDNCNSVDLCRDDDSIRNEDFGNITRTHRNHPSCFCEDRKSNNGTGVR